MTYGDGILLLDIGKEWSLIVDFEVKDPVLIRKTNFSAVGSRVGFAGGWDESDAVEGRKHRNFELQEIVGWDSEWKPGIP